MNPAYLVWNKCLNVPNFKDPPSLTWEFFDLLYPSLVRNCWWLLIFPWGGEWWIDKVGIEFECSKTKGGHERAQDSEGQSTILYMFLFWKFNFGIFKPTLVQIWKLFWKKYFFLPRVPYFRFWALKKTENQPVVGFIWRNQFLRRSDVFLQGITHE